ncbi:hypothetical protein AA2016_3547 [Aminobacter aminovorans]|nr:hypothetical protein AA2016_3547 [Aminobacter aminovorans]
MGHMRLGNPPTTRKWREVIHLLSQGDVSVSDLAEAVERAADRSLSEAVNDPAFVEALWLFLKIPQAAGSEDFVGELRKLGLRVPEAPSIPDVLAAFDGAIEEVRHVNRQSLTDFGLIAKNAALSALQSLVNDELPSLWKSTAEDERTTLATFASTERFGELAQRFFTNLLEGHLQYFLEREIPRHIGPGNFLQSVADARHFEGTVKRHCTETTIIIRSFAKNWLGKNKFHLQKDLSRRDAAGFAAHAFTKIRVELSRRSGRQL